MKAFPNLGTTTARILRASLATAGLFAVTLAADAGDKIIFSGRFEKRGLPDLTDRERLLPDAVSFLPQSAAATLEFAPASPNNNSVAPTRRQQELLEQRRNWVEHGLKRNDSTGADNANDARQPGDNEPRSRNPFDPETQKPDAKRTPNANDPLHARNRFDPYNTKQDDPSRPGNSPGQNRDDAFTRPANPGTRLPGDFSADNKNPVDLNATRLAPRFGLGHDNPIQQKLDRDTQFRDLLDPKGAGSARAGDFFSGSPELQRQQQQQSMGRAFEDILHRSEPVRMTESLRPKTPLAGNPLTTGAAKTENLADFSRLMAPAPAPERPRPNAAPFEFPKRAF